MDAHALLETLGIGTTLVLVLSGWRIAVGMRFEEFWDEARDPAPTGS